LHRKKSDLQKTKVVEIGVGRASLCLNHASERFKREGVGGMMKSNGHAATVSIEIVPMTSFLSFQREAVSFKSFDKVARRH